MKKLATKFKRGRESSEENGRSGRQKDATADENVKVVHTLVLCDRRRDLRSTAIEVGISFGEVKSILRHVRYVKSFGKMGAANVDK